MKFFTKEWYGLMQRLDYCLCMKPIADGDHSDADIQKLYDKKLKAAIARDRREYDAPPQFIDLDSDDVDIAEWVIGDPENGVLRKPRSKDEVIAELEAEKAAALEEYNNRPPFDPAETVAWFEEVYENKSKYGMSHFPEWAQKMLDPRLVALDYLPKSVYDRLKEESRRNKKEFDRINREASKTLGRELEKIKKSAVEAFSYFHDAEILRLDLTGGDLEMLVCLDGACFEDETPYVRVSFKNAQIVENDGLPFNDGGAGLKTVSDEGYMIRLDYLYDEFYSTADGGIEAHFLLAFHDLKYLTVRCSDITSEHNVEYTESV